MKWMKRAAASLLVAVTVALQAGFPVLAAEPSTGKGTPETLVGELCVYTQEQGVHKVDAALYDETMILVSPQTAADLADAELVDGENGQFEFWRDHYIVQVDTNTGKIDIGLSVKGETVSRLYQNESFILQEIQTVQFGREKTPAIPLEQMHTVWTHSAAEYRALGHIPQGWGWLALLNKGDICNFVGIVILAGMTIICFAQLALSLARRKEWLMFWIATAEVVVLLLAASGVLVAGAH